VPGVVRSSVGYIGGDPAIAPPTYASVCSRDNTFTEAVRLEFADPLSYEQLLKEHFLQDPRAQRAGLSSLRARRQTRIAVWVEDDAQEEAARRILAAAGKLDVIPVLPLSEWFEAEEEHQHFIRDEKDFPDWSASIEGDEDDTWETGPGTRWGL